jgi:pantetheine-phosphate adenylyltransferase
MRRAIYPGSFDPITNGHLDVVERARKLFDEVIVAVAHNDEKEALFSLQERVELLQETVGKIDRVRIAQFDGLLVEFAAAEKANAVIRGLRAVSDFEFEFQMALMNRKLDGNVETIFLMPKEEYTYLSSRLVKEIARLGGDVATFVPASVASALAHKLRRRTPKGFASENSSQTNLGRRVASGRRRGVPARGSGGCPLPWTTSLRARPRYLRRRVVGKRLARAAGGIALRFLPRSVRLHHRSAGVRLTHRIRGTGDSRFDALHARRPFTQSARSSALRPRRWTGLPSFPAGSGRAAGEAQTRLECPR